MERFLKTAAKLIAETVETDFEEIFSKLQFTPPDKFGDIAFPCFVLAGKLKKSPHQIAEDLKQNIRLSPEFEAVKNVGPYLNFKISPILLVRNILTEITTSEHGYGFSKEHSGETVVMDYSSPNIAKPFGLGHLRSTVIGNALMRIYRSQGYNAIGINHLGDWGTQFGKLIYAYNEWGDEKRLKDDPIGALFNLYVKFHKQADENSELEENARVWFKKLEDGDSYTVEKWNDFKKYSTQKFNKIYERLGISFEYQTGESFYNDKMQAVIDELNSGGLAIVSQDALVVDLENYGMPPALLKKKDEATLYITRDLAAAIYRRNTYNADLILYIVGSEQKLHFQQLFKVLELMGNEWAKDCIHVDFGRIKFEGAEMSTRQGNIIILEDVLDRSKVLALEIINEKNAELEAKEDIAEIIGLGAVIFAQFNSRRNKNISFSWNEALNFDGQTGPYIQYTHARLCSLQRKYGKELPADIDYSILTGTGELKLCKMLGHFPMTIKTSIRENEPSLIASYLIELASEFNRFYQATRIVVDDENIAKARIYLSNCIRIVINRGLDLLGIKAPEKM
ncbi:MAG: arginine--tRNA ligase [candidate division Zixibacteria bacterium]|nr:arginine--tRNA ligase [candidate division Zixibacteria bacterium]